MYVLCLLMRACLVEYTQSLTRRKVVRSFNLISRSNTFGRIVWRRMKIIDCVYCYRGCVCSAPLAMLETEMSRSFDYEDFQLSIKLAWTFESPLKNLSHIIQFTPFW